MYLAVTVKSGDMQNLMNIMNTVNIPPGSRAQTIVVMSNQKVNGSGSAAVQTALPVAQSNIVQGMHCISYGYGILCWHNWTKCSIKCSFSLGYLLMF